MDFSLSEEQKLIIDTTKKFVETELFPHEDLVEKTGNLPLDLIKEIQLKGANLRPTVKRSGSILTGIALLQDYDLIVDPSSKELIKELNNYVWATKGQTKPVDKWNHCIDAIRYAAQYVLANRNKGAYTLR